MAAWCAQVSWKHENNKLSPLSSVPKKPVESVHDGTMGKESTVPPPMLCHVQIHQYGTSAAAESASVIRTDVPREWSRSGRVGAFPILDRKGRVKGYRPTDEDCLMRRMDVRVFHS